MTSFDWIMPCRRWRKVATEDLDSVNAKLEAQVEQQLRLAAAATDLNVKLKRHNLAPSAVLREIAKLERLLLEDYDR